MTRSAFSYPLNRGADFEGGGSADLQTDVMRFMAILSMCLVAIFALVQSIPLTPPVPRSPPPAEERVPLPEPAPSPKPVVETPRQAAALPPPRPTARPAHRPEPPAEPRPEPARPLPLASPALPEPAPAPAPATQEPTDEGFTLRFESDVALRRLVARNEIGLYAINRDKALRMNVNRGSLSFWPASPPAQFHEMDATTVPADAVDALRRSGTPGAVKWGVTLPSKLSRDLDGYLREHSGGALIIGSDGTLRLER